MAALSDLKDVARRTAEGRFPAGSFSDVQIEEGVGMDGSGILWVRYDIGEGVMDQLDGDTLVDTIVDLSRAFQELGDERLPVVRYRTPSDPEDHGDPEG